MIFKQLVTKAPKLFGKIHIIGMRIFKARNLVPKRINLLGAVLCNFLDRRRFINLLTLFKYFNLKLFGNKIGYDLALPGVFGVKYLIRLVRADLFVSEF